MKPLKYSSKLMKYLLKVLIVLVLCCPIPVSAKSTLINNMTIKAHLNSSGTMDVYETWDMNVYEGTEIYKTFASMHDSNLQLISVKEGNKTFKKLSSWDTSASKSDKTYKCGIYKDDGNQEICFGIGSYGHHTYVMHYKVTHLVNQYKETQGINYAFMGDMSLTVKKATVHLSSDLSFNSKKDKIYAFGYEGDCVFENGHILMTSDGSINRLQLLAKLSESYSDPSTYHQSETFASVKQDATSDSSYEDDSSESSGNSILSVLLSLFFIIAFLIVLIALKAVHQMGDIESQFEDGTKTIDKDNVHPFRDIPTKNLNVFYTLARRMKIIKDEHRGGLISAYILKWVRDDQIRFVPLVENHLIFKKKDNFMIDFSKDLESEDRIEQTLYDFFVKASSDRLLKPKDFNAYVKSHYEDLSNWYLDVEDSVEKDFVDHHEVRLDRIKKHILFIPVSQDVNIYSMHVKELYEQIYGLYLFLKDENNMAEKKVIEVHLWDEYLMFASILGISDEVEKQLKHLQPHFTDTSVYGDHYFELSLATQLMMVSSIMIMNQALRNHGGAPIFGGGGGPASFGGGGGGFSGGGGGGVR